MADDINNIPISDAVPMESQPGPATPENQQATADAIAAETEFIEAEQAKKRQAQASLANSSPMALGREFSDTEVLDEMDRLDEDRARQTQLDAAEEQQRAEALQARVDQRKFDIQRAAQRGLELERDEELDPLIERQNQEAAMVQEQINAQNAITDMKVAEAQTPSEEEIAIAAEPIRQQAANVEAEKRQQALEATKQAEIEQAKNDRLSNIDAKIKSINEMRIDQNRYWNQKPTGQKILAALAMALGAYRQELTGSATNQALDIINKQIETDVELQRENRKLAVDELNALRADYWRSVQNKMDQMRFDSNDRLRNAQIQNVYSQIEDRKVKAEAAAQQAAANQVVQQKLSAGGLRKEDVKLLPKDVRKELVFMPNGSIQRAQDEKAAAEVRKAAVENLPAMEGIADVLDYARDGSKLSPERRAVVSTKLQALIGKLRIPLTGPGVLTDTEYERLRETIGNPNKIFTLPGIQEKKLETIYKMLRTDMNSRYQVAGLTAPKSKRQQLVETIKAKGSKKSDAEIKQGIDTLVKSGQLPSLYGISDDK